NCGLKITASVSITNPHNKTPYELLYGKVPNIRHLKPFGCQVTILNTSDHLGNFEGKDNDGFLVGYAAHSKAYRVYNLSSKKVEETLNLRNLEDKPNVQGMGQEWYFDLDYLTDSLGYTRFKTNPPAGTHATKSLQVHKLMIQNLSVMNRQEYGAHSAAAKHGFEFFVDTAALLPQADIEIRKNLVPAAGDPAGSIISAEFGDPAASASVPIVFSTDPATTSSLPPASNVSVNPVATKRMDTIHPQSQIIRALQSPVQTQSTVQKSWFLFGSY
nr:retrovirus-related Pol polyprotein from transposon TNT 1-94 [Tanacetum cinerariifolium]